MPLAMIRMPTTFHVERIVREHALALDIHANAYVCVARQNYEYGIPIKNASGGGGGGAAVAAAAAGSGGDDDVGRGVFSCRTK